MERRSAIRPDELRPTERPDRHIEANIAVSAASFEPFDLPLERAYLWERTRPESIFLTQPSGGKVRNWTWAEAMNEARRMAAYLGAQNWPDGSHLVILSKNSAWWIVAELAIWMSGHVTVPIYTSVTLESARQLFMHCEPVACFVGALDNPELVPERLAPDILCIRFPSAPVCNGVSWDAVIAGNEPIRSNPCRDANELATIIYTSGTTGSPKGVMHRFGAFPYCVKAVTQVTGEEPGQRMLSYLPLAHIAERALTEMTAIMLGWQIFFSESADTFLADLKRARPTFFFSVPRIYAKFRAAVWAKVPQRRLNLLLRIPLVNFFVRRRIIRELGLGSVRAAASGSAPLARDILLWFQRLGLPLAEGYGTTEIGITHTAPGGKGPPGYVGQNAPGVVTRISPQGEVLVSSPMNMLGYYKDPQATREAFTEDGFLRTGDLGELNAEGWLKINGRIKEQFKTSKGKYVLPSMIEHMLNANRLVESSLVMGSGLPAPFAVIVLSAEAIKLSRNEAGRNSVAAMLEQLRTATNERLSPHEHLKFLVLVTSKWSIEAGFLTPTLKIKRAVLEAHYASRITDWAARNSTLIWDVEET